MEVFGAPLLISYQLFFVHRGGGGDVVQLFLHQCLRENAFSSSLLLLPTAQQPTIIITPKLCGALIHRPLSTRGWLRCARGLVESRNGCSRNPGSITFQSKVEVVGFWISPSTPRKGMCRYPRHLGTEGPWSLHSYPPANIWANKLRSQIVPFPRWLPIHLACDFMLMVIPETAYSRVHSPILWERDFGARCTTGS